MANMLIVPQWQWENKHLYLLNTQNGKERIILYYVYVLSCTMV